MSDVRGIVVESKATLGQSTLPFAMRKTLETFIAKETRKQGLTLRKTPRLFLPEGEVGITVWTKWQSSLVYGDKRRDRKGETADYGDESEDPWENLLDLSHNLYSFHCHLPRYFS